MTNKQKIQIALALPLLTLFGAILYNMGISTGFMAAASLPEIIGQTTDNAPVYEGYYTPDSFDYTHETYDSEPGDYIDPLAIPSPH